jgi:hypothetical protein
MHYMHNEVRSNPDGSFTWCLVYFDFGTFEHDYRFITVR